MTDRKIVCLGTVTGSVFSTEDNRVKSITPDFFGYRVLLKDGSETLVLYHAVEFTTVDVAVKDD